MGNEYEIYVEGDGNWGGHGSPDLVIRGSRATSSARHADSAGSAFRRG